MKQVVITPLDTLFFRGAEPMEAGESHFNSILFPPMPSTLMGALRTGMLVQNKINFLDYVRGKAVFKNRNAEGIVGKPEEPGFSFQGPLFLVENSYGQTPLFPAPAHWFRPKNDHEDQEVRTPTKLILAKPMLSKALDFGLQSSLSQKGKSWLWATPNSREEIVSCAGMWVTPAAFSQKPSVEIHQSNLEGLKKNEPAIISTSELYDLEPRVGIGRNNFLKTNKEGRLFATTHIRLREGVSFLLFADRDLSQGLSETGNLQLGGEQRAVRYRLESQANDLFPKKEGTIWMALSPLPSSELNKIPYDGIATGKLIRAGGWNMKPDKEKKADRGFHKPFEAWYPAGTVLYFNESRKVDDNRFVVLQ